MKTSAETERGQEASAAASREQDDVLGEPSPAQRRGSGLKKIFDKLKRTNSGALLDGAGADASPPAAASAPRPAPASSSAGTAHRRRPNRPSAPSKSPCSFFCFFDIWNVF